MVSTLSTLVVSEVFGPTVQGEGPSAGQRASFVRFGGCNLSCSWCDTAYTWDGRRYDLRAELHRRPVDEVARRALAGNPPLVVLTGGEPLLHQRQQGWADLLDRLVGRCDIEVETNGTIAPAPVTLAHAVRFNVSPKLTHAGDAASARIRPDELTAFADTGLAIFKFVCATPAHVREAAELTYPLGIPPDTVWISPEGTTTEAVLTHTRAVAETTLEHGFNLGTRLHVLIWGDERGR
ncbi:MAG: 4Fe-4S cluster-binding domain-containing protein [Pseudonocardiaceae bacterium]|nr:4Fe-4S cluster-binding domain-containing protein [Pseudonocardiaceae bacterium]